MSCPIPFSPTHTHTPSSQTVKETIEDLYFQAFKILLIYPYNDGEVVHLVELPVCFLGKPDNSGPDAFSNSVPGLSFKDQVQLLKQEVLCTAETYLDLFSYSLMEGN